MALALIVPSLPGTPEGGQAYDRALVDALRARGETITVHSLADPRGPAGREAAAALLASLPSTARLVIDGLALPAFAGQEAMLASRRAIGLIHHPHALESGLSEQARAALRAVELTLLPRLARVIATSPRVAERLCADGMLAAAHVAVVTPGRAAVARSAGRNGDGASPCAILSVGALIERKDHATLLRALARLFDLDWHLRIVGSAARDPAHAAMLQALAQTLGIAARVTFAGALSDAALEEAWARTDLFALASRWEGYGMATAEALARGIPVAVTGGGPEGSAGGDLVDVETGIVVAPGDHEGMSKALRRLIFSATLRQEMGDAAWQKSRLHPDWNTQAGAFLAAIAASG
ncbi:MAG: glycosyltransferase family 4 protein [Rhodospirillales bacterium]|nr:glycosyltransferase family 4 protein [Rhodospirillales bacterium]